MSGGSFLDRWSRRKQEERRAEVEEAVEKPLETPVEVPLTGPPEVSAEPDGDAPLTEAELAALPRIEDLTAQSDLRPFLRRGVPGALKNAAMRKMWLLTPAIRDHKDCAVDYAWDWNTPGGVPGNGGRLDAASVQKMLKGLTGPAPDAEPDAEPDAAPDAATPSGPAPDPASDPAPDPAPTLRAETEPEAGPGKTPDTTPDTTPGTTSGRQAGRHPDPETEKPVRVRHGGAMPS